MFKKTLIFSISALFLTGCLASKSPGYKYYELSYTKDDCHSLANQKAKIYISNVNSVGGNDLKEIFIKQNDGKIRKVNDAKFVTFPSQMVYKSLIQGFSRSCEFSPLLSRTKNSLRLNTTLLDLKIVDKKAFISLQYELMLANKTISFGSIEKYENIKNFDSKELYKALNSALNKAVDEIINISKRAYK